MHPRVPQGITKAVGLPQVKAVEGGVGGGMRAPRGGLGCSGTEERLENSTRSTCVMRRAGGNCRPAGQARSITRGSLHHELWHLDLWLSIEKEPGKRLM